MKIALKDLSCKPCIWKVSTQKHVKFNLVKCIFTQLWRPGDHWYTEDCGAPENISVCTPPMEGFFIWPPPSPPLSPLIWKFQFWFRVISLRISSDWLLEMGMDIFWYYKIIYKSLFGTLWIPWREKDIGILSHANFLILMLDYWYMYMYVPVHLSFYCNFCSWQLQMRFFLLIIKILFLHCLPLYHLFSFSRNQEDVIKYIKRAINRFRKDVSIKVHKVFGQILQPLAWLLTDPYSCT